MSTSLPPPDTLTLFELENYGGKSRLFNNMEPITKFEYPIMSAKVVGELSWKIFSNADYKGNDVTLDTDYKQGGAGYPDPKAMGVGPTGMIVESLTQLLLKE